MYSNLLSLTTKNRSFSEVIFEVSWHYLPIFQVKLVRDFEVTIMVDFDLNETLLAIKMSFYK